MVNAVATIELYTFASWPRLGLHWMHSLCGAVTNFHLPPSPGWKKKAREHFRLTRKMRHYKKFKQFRLHSEEEPNITVICFPASALGLQQEIILVINNENQHKSAHTFI